MCVNAEGENFLFIRKSAKLSIPAHLGVIGDLSGRRQPWVAVLKREKCSDARRNYVSLSSFF